jgi:crotonobetainyl-CoA:carnitine CoA-transferase CaiB-like acyl-CoA transferase
MAAGTQALWETVCRILKSEHWLQDARFASTALRAQNQLALKELVEAALQHDTAANWIAALSGAGVPCCPINTYSAVLADTQTEAMAWVQPLAMANGHATRTVTTPLKFNGAAAPIARRPPRLGEHNTDILGSGS